MPFISESNVIGFDSIRCLSSTEFVDHGLVRFHALILFDGWRSETEIVCVCRLMARLTRRRRPLHACSIPELGVCRPGDVRAGSRSRSISSHASSRVSFRLLSWPRNECDVLKHITANEPSKYSCVGECWTRACAFAISTDEKNSAPYLV